MTKIAIIEDDPVISQMYRMKFEADGFDVQLANDGKKGVALVEHFSPDIILMDLQMPALDGLSAAKAIRSGERGRRTPIVALTANVYEEHRQASADAGMDGHLSKPFRPDELRAILDSFAGLPRSERA